MTYELGDLIARMKLDATDFRTGLDTLAGTGGGAAPVFSALRTEVTGLNQAFYQLNRDAMAMTRTGIAIGAAFAAPAAVIGESVKTFGDFDKAMTRSLAIMGDVSAGMRNDMARSARDLSDATIYSAKESAQAYYYLGSAGLSAADSIAALPTVTKFAQAGQTDLQRATQILTQSQTALGLAVKDDAVKNMENMVRVADVLVKADTVANATTIEFAEALTNRGAAALRLYHKSVEEGVAVLAAWAEQGIKGSVAGWWLQQVLRDLQTQAIKHPDVFKKLGISVFDASGNMRNMADIIQNLEQRFGGLSDKEIRSEMRMLGFQDRSVQAIQSLIGMSDEIRRFQGEFEKAGGTVDAVANRQIRNMNDQMTILWHKVQDLMMEFGQPLADKMKGWAESLNKGDAIGSIRKGFESLPGPMKAVISLGSAITVGLGLSGATLLTLGSQALIAAASINYLGGMSAVIGILKTGLLGLGATIGVITAVGIALYGVVEAFKTAQKAQADYKAGKIGGAEYAYRTAMPGAATMGDWFTSGMATAAIWLGGPPKQPSKPYEVVGPKAPTEQERIQAFLDSLKSGEEDDVDPNRKKYFSAIGIEDWVTKIKDAKEAISGLNLSGEQLYRALDNIKSMIFDAFNAGALTAKQFDTELAAVESRIAATGHKFNTAKPFDVTTIGLSNIPKDMQRSLDAASKMKTEVAALNGSWSRFLSEGINDLPPVLDLAGELVVLADKAGDSIAKMTKNLKPVPGSIEDAWSKLEKYGIKSQSELNRLADQAIADYNQIRDTVGIHTADVRDMWMKMIEAQLAAHRELPPEVLADYLRMKNSSKDAADQMQAEWRQVGQITREAFRGLSRDIARNLVEWKGWGKSVLNIAQDLGTSFLSIIIHSLIKPLEDQMAKLALSVAGSIAGVFGKKAAGGVIGPTIDMLGSTAGSVAGGAAGAAIGGGGSGAASAVSKTVASGISGILTSVFSGISAVTGIMSVIGQSRSNNILYRIETDLRGILNVLFLNGSGTLVDCAIRSYQKLEAIYNLMAGGGDLTLAGAGAGGTQIYIGSMTVQASDVDGFVSELKRRRIVQGR